ncbi:hypothetical protein LXA43DRAFT_872792, partial [Ganoderma leucocontextum]
TQECSLYPKLLHQLRPYSSPKSASLLGWHADGLFIQFAKRGAHAPLFLLAAQDGPKSFEEVYGAENLTVTEDWLMAGEGHDHSVGVRVITAAPEVERVGSSIEELTRCGIVLSIRHSIALTGLATAAVQSGARLITQLFNVMPQLHHRDPSILGRLGASPHLSSPSSSTSTSPVSATFPTGTSALHHMPSVVKRAVAEKGPQATSEAFDDMQTPPQMRVLRAHDIGELSLQKGKVTEISFESNSHPNSKSRSMHSYP